MLSPKKDLPMFRVAGLLCLLIAVLSGCGGPLRAVRSDGIDERLMLSGYDAVAYFTKGQPECGRVAIKADYDGMTFRFASEQHRRMFLAAPEKYVPQFGGFCTSGMIYGLKQSSDPKAWEIYEGKLYIFGDQLGKSHWSGNKAMRTRYAHQMWESEAKQTPSRQQTFYRWLNHVPWYVNRWAVQAERERLGIKIDYDTGNWLANMLWQEPGWRVVRDGYHCSENLGIK